MSTAGSRPSDRRRTRAPSRRRSRCSPGEDPPTGSGSPREPGAPGRTPCTGRSVEAHRSPSSRVPTVQQTGSRMDTAVPVPSSRIFTPGQHGGRTSAPLRVQGGEAAPGESVVQGSLVGDVAAGIAAGAKNSHVTLPIRGPVCMAAASGEARSGGSLSRLVVRAAATDRRESPSLRSVAAALRRRRFAGRTCGPARVRPLESRRQGPCHRPSAPAADLRVTRTLLSSVGQTFLLSLFVPGGAAGRSSSPISDSPEGGSVRRA